MDRAIPLTLLTFKINWDADCESLISGITNYRLTSLMPLWLNRSKSPQPHFKTNTHMEVMFGCVHSFAMQWTKHSIVGNVTVQ